MADYLALMRKEKGTSYGVDFPDFPGCASGGETLDEALRNAAAALAVHVEGMATDGEALPVPSGLEAVMADRHNRGAVAVLVPAPPIKGKARRINITLDEHLVAAIDRRAAEERAFALGRRDGVPVRLDAYRNAGLRCLLARRHGLDDI